MLSNNKDNDTVCETESIPSIAIAEEYPKSLSSECTEVKAVDHDGAVSAVTDHEHQLKCVEDPEFRGNIPSDGGYGWLVILGTFMVQVTSFGTASSWGILQDYYDVHMFRNTVSNSQLKLSFVGTIMEISVNLMGPLAQLISSRFGIKSVLILGAIMSTLGLELASLSTEIWHLYLTQGILFGAGASFLYATAMSTATLWFDKKRGLALGIASSGSGIGSLVFPFVINALNQTKGVGWSYRVLGFICLFCNAIACVFVKDKDSTKLKKGERTLKNIFDMSVLKHKSFMLFSCGSVISLMGYFIPYFFLPAYATYLGFSPSQGSALISIMSAGNFVGRILVGFIGDRIGRLNANIIFTFCTCLSTFLVWTFAYSYGVLVAYSVLFGLFCGSYFSMLSSIAASILNEKQYRTGVSMLLLFNIIGNFGISISSAIESAVSSEPYFSYKMFTGVSYFIAGVLLVICKLSLTDGLFKYY